MALLSAAKQKAVSDVRGMDTNHDGVVDQGEFTAGGGTKQEFGKHDANEDGAKMARIVLLRIWHRNTTRSPSNSKR